MGRPPGGGPPPDSPPPPGVEVRPARAGDVRSMIDMFSAVASELRFIRTESVSRDRARQVRRSFRRPWTRDRADIVAVADGRVVGHLGVEREHGPITDHVASLGMGVAREWRGRGIGSALLVEAFRWADWAGVEKLALTVYPGNDAALGLYGKFGFQEEGRLAGHSKKSYGYEDEVVMGRWL
jgi:L-phenylalanine/L-methionine N-acetyltransferase